MCISVLRIFPKEPLYSHSYSARSVGAQYIKFRSVFAVSFWSTESLPAWRWSGGRGDGRYGGRVEEETYAGV